MIARTALCSLLSICLSASAFVIPSRSAAAVPGQALALVANATQQQLAPASVLELDADDTDAGADLTAALRKAFAARGMSGGDEMSFAEVKLTMGCENDDPKCLAGAGESLGVDRMIYGYLRTASGGGYKVEVYVLDVQQGVIEAETAAPLSASDLSKDNIDDTAIEIVNSLFPDEEDGELPAPVPTGDPDADNNEEPVADDKPRRESPYTWGPYKPRPKWKWAGFGIGLGLTVAGAVAMGVGISQIREGGPLKRELFEAAEDSTTDGIDGNDVDPDQGGDLCARAEAEPMGMPGKVTNRAVAVVCRRSRIYVGVTNGGIAALVVGLVMTAAFTTLLFVHKDKEKARTAKATGKKGKRQRRLLRLDATPTRNGFTLGGSGRF